MRLSFIVILILFFSCRSETAVRELKISTQVEIKLPADAIYGNLSSFSGFQTIAPNLFIEEKIEEINGVLKRTLILADQTIITDKLIELDDDRKSIRFETIKTNLAIDDLIHSVEVKILSPDLSEVSWKSEGHVQNQYRGLMKDKIKGIQETYLFSLELLGEELEELLNDPEF